MFYSWSIVFCDQMPRGRPETTEPPNFLPGHLQGTSPSQLSHHNWKRQQGSSSWKVGLNLFGWASKNSHPAKTHTIDFQILLDTTVQCASFLAYLTLSAWPTPIWRVSTFSIFFFFFFYTYNLLPSFHNLGCSWIRLLISTFKVLQSIPHASHQLYLCPPGPQAGMQGNRYKRTAISLSSHIFPRQVLDHTDHYHIKAEARGHSLYTGKEHM